MKTTDVHQQFNRLIRRCVLPHIVTTESELVSPGERLMQILREGVSERPLIELCL